jgi:hypothetical protein
MSGEPPKVMLTDLFKELVEQVQVRPYVVDWRRGGSVSASDAAMCECCEESGVTCAALCAGCTHPREGER